MSLESKTARPILSVPGVEGLPRFEANETQLLYEVKAIFGPVGGKNEDSILFLQTYKNELHAINLNAPAFNL